MDSTWLTVHRGKRKVEGERQGRVGERGDLLAMGHWMDTGR